MICRRIGHRAERRWPSLFGGVRCFSIALQDLFALGDRVTKENGASAADTSREATSGSLTSDAYRNFLGIPVNDKSSAIDSDSKKTNPAAREWDVVTSLHKKLLIETCYEPATSKSTGEIESRSTSSSGVHHDHTLLLFLYSAAQKQFCFFDASRGRSIGPFEEDLDAFILAESVTAQGCLNKLVIIWDSRSAVDGDKAAAIAKRLTNVGLRVVCEGTAVVFSSSLSVSTSEKENTREGCGDPLATTNAERFWASVVEQTLHLPRPRHSPVETMLHYVMPMAQVRILHAVSLSKEDAHISVALLDPLGSHSPAFLRGTISEVLQKLLLLPHQLIFVPTFRTDRSLLLALRSAMQTSNRQVIIVYPTDIPDGFGLKTRISCSSQLLEYWKTLKGDVADTDAVLAIRETAAHVRRRLREEVVNVSPQVISQRRHDYSSGADDVSRVGGWLGAILGNERRRAAEEACRARVGSKALFISWVATDYTAFGRPENPTSPVNRVLCISIANQRGDSWTSPVICTKRHQATLPSLDGYDTIVLHHAKHFLILQWHDEELQRFLRRGGTVWCISLAEYLLSAQQIRTSKLTLGEMGVRSGCVSSADSHHAFNFNCCPESTPRRLIEQHLGYSSAVLQGLFPRQIEHAVQDRQLLSLAHRMDALLAFADMEASGIYIDRNVAHDFVARTRNELTQIAHALLAFTPRQMPVDLMRHFDWSSPVHLRAHLLGGSIVVGGPASTLAQPSIGWLRNVSLLALSSCAAAPGDSDSKSRQKQSSTHHPFVQRYLEAARADPQAAMPPQSLTALSEASQATTFRFVVLDIESTGLNLATDEIVEIGLWDPVEQTQFATIVNPKRHIPQETIDIHQITSEMAAASPSMDTVALDVAKFLRLLPSCRRPHEVLIILAHNAFALDEPMLRRALNVHCPEAAMDDVVFCDSVAILKSLRSRSTMANRTIPPKVRDHLAGVSLKLGELAAALHISTKGQLHRAITDAKLCWSILRKVLGVRDTDSEASARAAMTKLLVQQLRHGEATFLTATRAPQVTVTFPGRLRSRRDSALRKMIDEQLVTKSSVISIVSHLKNLPEAALICRKVQLECGTTESLLQWSDSRNSLVTQHADMCIRPLVDMTLTSTSRTASMLPSAHTFPKKGKSDLRRLLTSRFGNEGVCVEVDYSQLEIVVMAVLCNDRNMIKMLNDGVDFHITRASQFSGKTYEEISDGCRRGDEECIQLRQKAKEFSFQRLYGAGASLIQKTTRLPTAAIKKSIEEEKKTFPEMQAFYRMVRSVALRPQNPGLPHCFHFELPTGAKVAFSPKDCIHNLPPIKNYPIQGYGAELVQMALGKLFRHALQNSHWGGKAFIVNFVHDAVWLDVHNDVLDAVVADTLKILRSIDVLVPQTFDGVHVPVSFPCSVSVGKNMFDMKKY